MPDDAQWQEFDALREEHAAESMIWEDKPLEAIVDRLAERGVSVVVFRPCGNVPEEGDYMEVMRRNVERLRPVFAGP
jgi:zinc transport system substrate-binding protein